MSRMSKKRKQEWSFFLNDRNRITYNALCRKCVHECKQSIRAIVIECSLAIINRGNGINGGSAVSFLK